MATNRYVDTRFWIDGWIRKLNPLDRYVFLYFLTNDHSSWCGVYEIPIETAAYETGIKEQELLTSILPRLAPKIIFIDGWAYIKNFEKYHENGSEKTKKGISEAWKQVPENIRLKIRELSGNNIPHTRGIQGVSPSTSTSTSTLIPVASAPGSNNSKNMIKYNENRHSTDDLPAIDLETGESPKTDKPDYKELMSFWKEEIGTNFMNLPKQYRAIKTMRANGFSDEDIKDRALLMKSETFYREHGFDFMGVLSDFSRRKSVSSVTSIDLNKIK